MQDQHELEAIAPFKRGFKESLEAQAAQANTCQQLLASNLLSGEERKAMQNYRAEVDSLLGEIQTATRRAIFNLQDDNLEKEAQREIHSFFRENPSAHQLSFITFLRFFTHLREHTHLLERGWKHALHAVREAQIPEKSDFYTQFVRFRVEPCLTQVGALKTVLRRTGFILGIPVRHVEDKKSEKVARYFMDRDYRFSAVYQEDLYSRFEPVALPEQKSSTPAESQKIQASHRLNAGGSQAWNTTPFYSLAYDRFLLDQERKKYPSVVHIDTHMGAEAHVIKGDIIRNLTRKVSHLQPTEIEALYADFLHTYFDLVTDICVMDLGLDPGLRRLFLFHLGPYSFYNLTKRFLQQAQTGTFQRKKGATIVKYIPAELLKLILMTWWRTMVLPGIGPEKDDYGLYTSLVRQIRSQMQKALKETNCSDINQGEFIARVGAPIALIYKRFQTY